MAPPQCAETIESIILRAQRPPVSECGLFCSGKGEPNLSLRAFVIMVSLRLPEMRPPEIR